MLKLPPNLQVPLQLVGQGFLSLAWAVQPTDPHSPEYTLTSDEYDEEDLSSLAETVSLSYVPELFGANRCGPQGPYNQFAKSEDFFHKSLSWSPRWFRSLYR